MVAGETRTVSAAAPTLQELEMDPTQRTIGEPEPTQNVVYAQAQSAEATGIASAGPDPDDTSNVTVEVVEPEPVEQTPEAQTETVVEPPRSGPGSGRDVWATYAESLGVVVEDGATREDIITAVDAAK